MIRVSDLANAAAWTRPATSASRTEAREPASWFDGEATGVDVHISGDLSPSSRSLSVEQHASRVLSFLCGEQDPAA
jgi:hypothetical protein